MRKWLIPLSVLALLIAGATTAAFAVGGSGESPAPVTSADDVQEGECSLVHNLEACDDIEGPPVSSDQGISPDECSLVHNVDACDQPVSSDGSAPPGGAAGSVSEPSSGTITSADGIPEDECNAVHNIDACSPEELEKLGGGYPPAPVRSDEGIDPNECNPVHNVDAC